MYGIEIERPSDRYLYIAEKAMDGLSEAMAFGKRWVDLVPALKYIPPWIPGATFHTVAAGFRPFTRAVKEAPYEAAFESWVSYTLPTALKSGHDHCADVDKGCTYGVDYGKVTPQG